MNSLTLEMMESIYTLTKTTEGKNFLLIGDKKALSIGDDMQWLQSNPRSISKYLAHKARCEMKLKEINSLCVITGACMGSGAGLALSCQLRVATASSTFCLPENSFGYTPDMAALHFLTTQSPELAMYLALTGCSLRGAELMVKGIATHYISEENLNRFLEEAKNTSDLKALCDKYHSVPQNAEFNVKRLEAIEKFFGKVVNIEGLYEKLALEEPNFRKTILGMMDQQCPLTLKVWDI
jgi:3-hydroxyisobutyryl-CoA hydrolase